MGVSQSFRKVVGVSQSFSEAVGVIQNFREVMGVGQSTRKVVESVRGSESYRSQSELPDGRVSQ